MKFIRLIATTIVAAASMEPACAHAEDIALSLVHPKGHIDIPVSAVRQVEAWATTKIRKGNRACAPSG
jgi:hypothetical protein